MYYKVKEKVDAFILEYIKEAIGLVLCSFSIMYAISNYDWSFWPGFFIGTGLILICWNFLDYGQEAECEQCSYMNDNLPNTHTSGPDTPCAGCAPDDCCIDNRTFQSNKD